MKQNKITFLTTCMLLLVHACFSQINVDSLLQNQPPSQLEIIDKARTLLMDAFVQNDKPKVQELYKYLSENFDRDNYVTLFPAEKTLLFAWSGDFENMLQYAKEADSAYIAQMQKKIMPTYANNFYQTAKERIEQVLEVILNNLQASSLTQEEKDFATIYLHYFLVNYRIDENFDTIVCKINTDTRKFITAYPNSEYIKLLDSYELKPSNWGWGLGANFGYSAKTGTFSNSFKDGGAMDMYIDITYKKVMITTGVLLTSGRVREDILMSEGSILPKGTNGSMYYLYLSLGYRFFNDKRLIVTPIAGIGTTSLNPGSDKERKENPALKQFDHSYGLTANFGIMTDIRLGKMKRMPGQNFIDPSFYTIRLSYKFLYNNLKDTPNFCNGNLHTITVGINFFMRQANRVKYK